MPETVAPVAMWGQPPTKDKNQITEPDQYRAARETCFHIADRMEQGWAVAIGQGLNSAAVEQVAVDDGEPNQRWLDRMTLAEAKDFLGGGHFAPSGVIPNMQAVIWFLEARGNEAIITKPENVARALAGETATQIMPE